MGEVDLNTRYHVESEMYPVGFTPYRHDRVTGSLFGLEVSNGRDLGLEFTVRRLTFAAFPLPNASTTLIHSMAKCFYSSYPSSHIISSSSSRHLVPVPPNGDKRVLEALNRPKSVHGGIQVRQMGCTDLRYLGPAP